MFTPLITHDLDGAALAAPVDAARRNGAAYKTRTIDDLRIKDDRLRAAIEGTGHLLFDGGMGTMLQAAGMKAGALPELLNFEEPQVITDIQRQYVRVAGAIPRLPRAAKAGIEPCTGRDNQYARRDAVG